MMYSCAFLFICIIPFSLQSAAGRSIVPSTTRAPFSLYPSGKMSPEEKAAKILAENSIKEEHRDLRELSDRINEVEQTSFVTDGARLLALAEKYEPVITVHEKTQAGQPLSPEEAEITKSTTFRSYTTCQEKSKESFQRCISHRKTHY